MPSRDRVDPKLNAWLSSDPERPRATAPLAPGERRQMSAQVQRLARRLGVDPDDLARKIPPDTLRRTKYPVLEIVNEDGTRTFKHDLGIEEATRSLVHR